MRRARALLLAGAGAATGAAAVSALRRRALRSRPHRDVLDGGPLIIAHRGGAGLAPENTLAAFLNAAETWNADMMELDVRVTADGHCVVIHDATVDRTTDGSGAVAEMTLARLRELDAGYRYTADGGHTYPFRRAGVTVPTIDEVLDALPAAMRFTVEVKIGTAQRPLFDAIRIHGAEARVVAAGMHDRDRTLFPGYAGALSASSEQAMRFYIAHRLYLPQLYRVPADVVQVPEYERGHRVVSPSFVRELHRQSVLVHVWTVNEAADMNRLLDYGVDGLVTDRPDRLGAILQRRLGRPLAGGHAVGAHATG